MNEQILFQRLDRIIELLENIAISNIPVTFNSPVRLGLDFSEVCLCHLKGKTTAGVVCPTHG